MLSTAKSYSLSRQLRSHTCRQLLRRCLSLQTGACYVPNLLKSGPSSQGEDAFFSCGRSFGVADGVGGWSEVNIDAGIYARQLIDKVHQGMMPNKHKVCSPTHLRSVLARAYQQTKGTDGSSTICFAEVTENAKKRRATMQVLNLGDSAATVWRIRPEAKISSGGDQVTGKQPLRELAFKTPPQLHSANYPFQLGGNGTTDMPESAQHFEVSLQSGDVILLATDGLWDNLFITEIRDVISAGIERRLSASEMATDVARAALSRSYSMSEPTPWSMKIQNAEGGDGPRGGKPDDITVLICHILESSAGAPT